jgi:uncharacterized membrane protein YphA (DoxX/SURF4 family)
MDFPHNFEELKVDAAQLVDKVKEAIHEGNVRRIIIKDGAGHTFMELPLTVAAIGVIAVPILTAIGALAAMAASFTVVIERNAPPAAAAGAGPTPPGSSTPVS